MIDNQASRIQNKTINVTVHTEGNAPYIPIGHDQVDVLRELLDKSGFAYTVDRDASEAGGKKVAVFNLGAGADVAAVQKTLDAFEERPGRNAFGGRKGVKIIEKGKYREEHEWEIPIQDAKARQVIKKCDKKCPSHPNEYCDGALGHNGPCYCGYCAK